MAAEHINLYTARHYEADKAIYAAFTKETGIEVKRIIAEGSALFIRLKAEGKKSPADVLLTVDAITLARASHEGLFQAAHSDILHNAIPENLRAKDHTWYAYTLRPRVIAYNVKAGKPAWLNGYASLAGKDAKGKVCTRSSSSGYSMGLLTHLIGTTGEKETAAWTKGLVGNFARKPQGNDTAQLKAVASGDCGVALVNSYYYGKMLVSKDPAEKAAAKKVALYFPENPAVSVSAAGVAAGAPNKAGAVNTSLQTSTQKILW
jgi:iron(III) transport system substrate-binding protein